MRRGRRRYVESLSAYARQFLDQMEKPDVDFIEGLSPAIAIEQRSAGANPKIDNRHHDGDLRLLARPFLGGRPAPRSRRRVSRFTAKRRNKLWIKSWPMRRTRKSFCWRRWCRIRRGEFRDVIEKAKREGFVRVRVDGEIVELDRPDPIRSEEKHAAHDRGRGRSTRGSGRDPRAVDRFDGNGAEMGREPIGGAEEEKPTEDPRPTPN